MGTLNLDYDYDNDNDAKGILDMFSLLVNRPLRHHRLEAPGLMYLGRLIHDIEVNVWERKALPETREVEDELQRLLAGSDTDRLVGVCLKYFDGLDDRHATTRRE